MPEFKGSCRCGAVTTSATADPIFAGICHCTSCQKVTGSAFGSVIAVPEAALTISGNTTQYDSTGDSGQPTHRRFCPKCGATVAEWADIMPGVMMLPIGSLEDTGSAKPMMQIYCDSAMAWAVLPEMQSFPKMPMPG